ncbi:unnamed protein product, partial [Musa hybrid cultivar]
LRPPEPKLSPVSLAPISSSPLLRRLFPSARCSSCKITCGNCSLAGPFLAGKYKQVTTLLEADK